jgi:hypothetical protein
MDHLTCFIRHRAHCMTGQRIFDALVQPANSVAVESFLSHFQMSCQKMFRWQFLHCEADGVRGVGKSAVSGGLPASVL